MDIAVTVLDVVNKVKTIIDSVSLVVNVIKTFVGVVVDAAKSLGIIKADVNAEELGAQSLQAKEAGVEFGVEGHTYTDSLNEVANMKLDPEKSNNYSPEEKMRAAGELVTGALIESHPGIEKILNLAVSGNGISSFFSPERISEYVKLGLNLANVASYLKGTITSDELIEKTSTGLQQAEKNISPELTDKEIPQITNRQFGSVK